jgi:hypothetical protein
LSVLQGVFSFWSLALANLNILPMISNIFVPMYQDQTFTGKIMSFFLRLGWVFLGSLLMVCISIPLVGIVIVWICLPILCFIQIIRFLV